jgi:uncharacterized protein YndB with AHSA1/START domain
MSTDKLQVETKGSDLVMTRQFDAPRKVVFETYTDCKHLKHWWGPREWPLSYCKMEFRAGGKWHFCMKGPEGMESWGMAVYKDIKAPEYIHYEDYFSDKDGKLNKEMPWTLIKLEFVEKNGKTVVKTSAKYPNPEDLKKVIDMGLIAGMTETLERLDEYLVKLK